MNNTLNNNSRRNFIKNSTASCLLFSLPSNFLKQFNAPKLTTKIGVITDLHHDIMHDGFQRLHDFTDAAQQQNVNAIFQLGDFAYPSDKNKNLIDHFNHAHKNAFHVLGNHDTDAGYTTQDCINSWKMPNPYYTKIIDGITFIILDCNEKGSPNHKGGYPSYIGPQQLNWLEDELKSTKTPVIIVSHQPLAGHAPIDNAETVQNLLEAHQDKILIAINGHTHINMHLKLKGVHYVHLNSASYLWAGGEYLHQSYSKELHDQHKWIAYTCPYKDSLYSFISIDFQTLTVKIEGRKSEWVGSSPKELGLTNYSSLSFDDEVAPIISDRVFHRQNK